MTTDTMQIRSSCNFIVRIPIYWVGLLLSSNLIEQIAAVGLTKQPEIGCGRVPIYEKQYKVSINYTLEKKLELLVKTDEDDGDFRILYGLDAILGEWPWIARINMCSEQGCRYCTGALLDSRWILSAGHCGAAANVSKLSASLGLYDLVSRDKIAVDIKLDKFIVHPEFNDELDSDLALFRLEKPVEFNDFIQPVCLVGEGTKNLVAFAKKKRCYVIGYGMTEGMHFAVKLQKLSISVRKPGACNSDKLNEIELRRGTICIGPHNEKNTGSSCQGDSGGPNVCYEPEFNRWSVFGVVSYGPANCDREAGDKWLSVAADLTGYRSWLLSTMAANSY